MKNSLTIFLGLILMVSAACQKDPGPPKLDEDDDPAQDTLNPFAVIDAMRSQNKEDLTKYGLKLISIKYAPSIWPGTSSNSERQNLPEKSLIESFAKNPVQNSLAIYLFDIEHWELDLRKTMFTDSNNILQGDTALIRANVAKMVQIIKWAKAANPYIKFGYYGEVPIRDYFTPFREEPENMEKWKQANDLLQPLADECDVLCPSVYTFYTDREGWVKYATGMIREAKRLAKGKPVYAFLWCRYHGDADTYIEGEYWKLELETLYNEDITGVILWDGTAYNFQPEQGWWTETIAFMNRKGIVK